MGWWFPRGPHSDVDPRGAQDVCAHGAGRLTVMSSAGEARDVSHAEAVT